MYRPRATVHLAGDNGRAGEGTNAGGDWHKRVARAFLLASETPPPTGGY
ncbi:MAG: hypothetical protein JW797_02115 [Bradymonadales bacterium]|nr:hypothetical protein [Bradymonadales bacterium]